MKATHINAKGTGGHMTWKSHNLLLDPTTHVHDSVTKMGKPSAANQNREYKTPYNVSFILGGRCAYQTVNVTLFKVFNANILVHCKEHCWPDLQLTEVCNTHNSKSDHKLDDTSSSVQFNTTEIADTNK